MLNDHSISNETSHKVEAWTCKCSLHELKGLNHQAKEGFLYQGITFAVYGKAEGTDRIIAFDLIPRNIAKQQ